MLMVAPKLSTKSAMWSEMPFFSFATRRLTGSVAAEDEVPVPSASLVLLATIVDATGLEYNESHFGLILMIDWFLDRMQTMVNVIGDATVTAVVQAHYGVVSPE